MSLIQGIKNLKASHRPSVVSIGNFDGVHRGHQHIVKTLLERAEAFRLPSTVVTFEPLAKEFFAPGSIARLTTLTEKSELLHALGVDQVLSVEFNQELAGFSPERFVKEILVDGLGTRFLSVGDDFRFGHKRAGDFNTLLDAGERYGFSVQKHQTILHNGERISSGRIRLALENDDLDSAATLLGRPYFMSGVVSVGQKLGRTLDFPTANIVLGERRVPVNGVYAVRLKWQGQPYAGVANVGVRPTVDGKEQRLEVHVFDFADDLYGSSLQVEFVSKIRAEHKFDSLDALKAQIQADAQRAREILL